MPQADDRVGEHGITVEQIRAGLLQMMRDTHDLIHALQHITALVFDPTFPWPLVNKLGETGRKCRGLIGPHKLWDLTNDPAVAVSIRNALLPLTDDEAERAFDDRIGW